MNCPRHPQKRVVGECKECGSGFCIECVRETDQTALCADCLRRKRGEIEREYGGRAGGEGSPRMEGDRVHGKRVPESAGFSSEAAGQGVAGPVRAGAGGDARAASRAVEGPHNEPPTAAERTRYLAVEPGAEAGKAPKAKEGPAILTPAAGTTGAAAGFRARVKGLGSRRGREGTAAEAVEAGDAGESPGSDFLSQGPDEDFSLLQGRSAGTGARLRKGRKAAGKASSRAGAAGTVTGGEKDGSSAASLPVEEDESAPAVTGVSGRGTRQPMPAPQAAEAKAETRAPVGAGKDAAASEDDLLRDVVSTLLMPEGRTAAPQRAAGALVEERADLAATAGAAGAGTRKRNKERRRGRKGDERWAFLAQPRSSEYTLIALSWWRAALFIAAVLLGGAVIWAAVNAYLIPRDTEYGALAIIIGVLIGLTFWWKAGRKHGTKLAVQASIVTFFSLFLGEFLHWFLIVVKNKAFRTIFFDLVSFRFLWENGAEIMRNVVEAMFPTGFLLLLILPTLAAFIITFGMPPIPEVFGQFWRALRGENVEREEAGHGLEG